MEEYVFLTVHSDFDCFKIISGHTTIEAAIEFALAHIEEYKKDMKCIVDEDNELFIDHIAELKSQVKVKRMRVNYSPGFYDELMITVCTFSYRPGRYDNWSRNE